MKAKEIINWVVYFVCLLAVVFVINTFVVQRTMVSGDSMYPYLHNKDQLMMDKLSYRFHDPERFDIVVFPVVRDGKEEYYIKRVIGLPGETVQIIDGYVYINGEKLDENYGAEVMNDAGRAAEPITLGDDEYFVLGDNRNRSDDSRYENVENLKREKIVGRARPITGMGIKFFPGIFIDGLLDIFQRNPVGRESLPQQEIFFAVVIG